MIRAITKYWLGGVVDGKLYYYSSIGEFYSLATALDLQARRERTSLRDAVIEVIPQVDRGVWWANQIVLRDAVTGDVLAQPVAGAVSADACVQETR